MKKKKNNIIVLMDFDRTIFNTDKFIIDLKNIFKKNGVGDKSFKKSYKKIKPYNIPSHIKNIEIKSNIKKVILNQTSKITKNLNKYIFTDAKSFLRFTQKNKIKTWLVTYGHRNFQKMKINNSKISSYFYHIYISPKYRIKTKLFNEILEKYKNKKIVIIDDMRENTSMMTKKYPHIYAIKINRKNTIKKTSSNKINYFEVRNLCLAQKIISLL